MNTQTPTAVLSREEITNLRNSLNRLFRASAKAWERGNNSGIGSVLSACEKESGDLATKAEALIEKHCPGVVTDYPGLYPSFTVNGYGEYSVDGMLTSFFNLPRNFFKQY